MEWFFNDIWSNRVQLVSLPLELLGFVLVLIELYWPDVADRLETRVDTVEIRSWKKLLETKLLKGAEVTKPSSVLTGLIIVSIPISLTGALAGYIWYYILNQENETDLDIIAGGVMGLVAVGITIVAIGLIVHWILMPGILLTMKSTVSFLNSITNGKALGAIGLVLAFLGLIGEFYQVITMWTS